MRTRHVDVGHPVAVREWGDGDRRILALHAMGAVSSGALFGSAVGPLVAAGWCLVAPDLPGYADTPPVEPGDYDLTRLAELMWRVADEGGSGPLVVLGHSLGGAVALRMHALRPGGVSALVLLDSGHLDYGALHPEGLDRSLDDWLAEAAEPLSAADRAELARALELDADDEVMTDLLVAVAERGGRLVSRTDPHGAAAARYHLVRARCSHDWAGLAAAATPTLLLLATEPDESRSQNEEWGSRFDAAVPQADVRLVPGATHSIVTDLRRDLGDLLADWLAGVA